MIIETKTLTVLMALFGYPMVFIGIVDNYGTWRATLLMIMGGLILLVQLVRHCVRLYFYYQNEIIKLRRARKQFEDDQEEGDPSKKNFKRQLELDFLFYPTYFRHV